MKKKDLLYLLAALLLMGVLLVILFWGRPHHRPIAISSPVAGSPKRLQPSLSEQERHDTRIALKPTDEEWRRIMEAPIEFYGKVVDQDNKPLVGIEIRCSWTGMTSMDSLIVKSNAPDGRFEVRGKKAAEMHFGVILPDGYRKTETSSQRFLFADYSERLQEAHKAAGKPLETKHLPNSEIPVIFRIKKIGAADTLHKAYQGSYYMPRDGTPRYFSISEPSVDALVHPRANSVEFRLVSEEIMDDNAKVIPLNWSIVIRVPGGGLQPIEVEKDPTTNDYDELLAPEGGYQEEINFEFPKSMPNWRPQFAKEFFLRFPGNKYGRATIRINTKGVVMDSLFNPSSSRNLLFDETKVVELKKTR